VVYVQPTVVRPIVYQPVGYIYHPYYYYQPYYVARPYVYIPSTYWASNTCYQTACYADYDRCLSTFGDGCFCYPGLLRCMKSSCYSSNAYWQPIYDQCQQSQNIPTRCVVSCVPAPYPLAPTGNQALLPGVVTIATGNNGTSNTTITRPTADTVVVQYSVVAMVLIQGMNSSAIPDTEYDFAGAVATSLAPTNATTQRDNVTLSYRDVIINNTAFAEVTIGVVVPSAAAMNATDMLFQSMMYGNVTNGTLGQTLKAANVLFNETQLSFDTIRSNAFVGPDPALVNTTGSPWMYPPRSASEQTIASVVVVALVALCNLL
ncbi:hypothetical protein As57867_005962, partial [Aphanomyces stellatus]